MFFILSKLLDFFLSPLTWGLVLVAAAVPWRGPGGWRWRRAAGGVGLLILLAASCMPLGNALAWRLEHEVGPSAREDATYDAVVLLGGVVDEEVVAATGQPSYNENVERLIVTHRLLREGRARLAILSGAALNPELVDSGEARVLGRQLEDWGIARERIVVEDRARNTRENAVYVADIARARGLTKLLVVTSAFHMPRARECFRAVDLPVDLLPVDYRARPRVAELASWLPRAVALAASTATLREMSGRVVYRVQGFAKP